LLAEINQTDSEEYTLLKLLQDHEEIKLKGEEGTYGFYIIELVEVSSNDYQNTYWSIEVNGEYSLVGISDIELSDDDIIELSLIGY